MMGVQCSKRLWLYRNRPDLRPEISASQQMIFERGTDVGKLAQQLFPGGKDATPIDHYSYPLAIRQTFDWITMGEKIVYEAAFQYDRVMAALDILVKTRGKWHAYEVKSSTSVKGQYITDAALQYCVLTNAGLPLADISIIHLNSEYVREGNLNISELFTIVSVHKEVLAMQPYIKEWISKNKKTLQLKGEPQKDIGPHCSDPYECEFQGSCWMHIPEVSVFNLTRLNGQKKFDLYYEGVIELCQIPVSYSLSNSQQLQVKAHLEDYTHIERENIREWVQELEYPLYFMDFETFMPAVPLYNDVSPYNQIPCQFSVHIQKAEATDLLHYAFLGDPMTDPREEFIKQLIAVTKGNGSILVYNKTFEATRLRELQEAFPQYNSYIEIILDRLIDLMVPFQKKWYYASGMNGSYSIKSVLPALVPEMSYDGMKIGDGGTAMAAFEGLLNITNEKEKEQVRTALLEYCKLDTFAMVMIFDKLKMI